MKNYSVIDSKSEPGKVMIVVEELELNSFGMPKSSKIGYSTKFVPTLSKAEMLEKLNAGEVEYELVGEPNEKGFYRVRSLGLAE